MSITTPGRRFGEIAGTVYLALGILGFAATGLGDFTDPVGTSLAGFVLNPLHNVTHVVIGSALLLAASRSESAVHTTTLVVAVATGSAGLLGLAIGGAATPLALNTADNVGHLFTALAATSAWLLDGRAVAGGV